MRSTSNFFAIVDLLWLNNWTILLGNSSHLWRLLGYILIYKDSVFRLFNLKLLSVKKHHMSFAALSLLSVFVETMITDVLHFYL